MVVATLLHAKHPAPRENVRDARKIRSHFPPQPHHWLWTTKYDVATKHEGNHRPMSTRRSRDHASTTSRLLHAVLLNLGAGTLRGKEQTFLFVPRENYLPCILAWSRQLGISANATKTSTLLTNYGLRSQKARN